ncbi:right-handed parallel beta-helix repeat-containing protein, partial [Candidatus Bathyarchaeota archaeon]|nr:right-handed parallel beta-helix repeat-containing protein [Candidatus Bathyarchaeota archaeon]
SEYDSKHIRNAKLIPVAELEGRLDELNVTDEILVYCHSGGRSAAASQILVDNGFLYVYNMLGGIIAWISEGYPVYVKYSSIQEAINNANPGDTLYISSGTYYENVAINKSLSLFGENAENTTIDGSGTTHAVHITARNVVIAGFTAQNAGDSNAINVWHSNNIVVSNNRILSSRQGVQLVHSYNVSVANNSASNNQWAGIHLYHSFSNRILNNYVTENLLDGITLHSSHDNLVADNVVSNNSPQNGICIWDSSFNNAVISNIAYGNNLCGLFVGHSHDNLIANNTSYGNQHGIGIWTVAGRDSFNNTICGNTVRDNLEGISLRNVTQNHIYHNNIINNSQQVNNLFNTHESTAIWDNGYPSGGNYWSDYAGIDDFSGPYKNETGSDGIGDTPYVIDTNNTDFYPLKRPHIPWDTTGPTMWVPDGKCDIRDIALVAMLYGSVEGDGRYDVRADITGPIYLVLDGKIDIRDIALIAIHYGEVY